MGFWIYLVNGSSQLTTWMLPIIFLFVGLCIYRLNTRNRAAAMTVVIGSFLVTAGIIVSELMPRLPLDVGIEGGENIFTTPAFPRLDEAMIFICLIGTILVLAGLIWTFFAGRMTRESSVTS